MPPSSHPPLLASNDVHIWQFTLDADPTPFSRFLSPDEHQRAARFLKPELRTRFTVARGQMRHILSAYANVPPNQLRFTYGTAGKPALIGSPLHFNLSHSKGLALLAVAAGEAVGIDLERERPIDVLGVGRRVFSDDELHQLAEAPEQQQIPLFFQLWVRHEAQIKALGTVIGSEAQVPVYDLAIDPPFHAALATAIPSLQIKRFH
jgi:4'-phosphopantetheinyl transferase